jgi:hypothetical protein
MEIKGGLDTIGAHGYNDGMTGIIPTSTASTNVSLCSQDIDKFALALIAPLGAEDNGDRLQTG